MRKGIIILYDYIFKGLNNDMKLRPFYILIAAEITLPVEAAMFFTDIIKTGILTAVTICSALISLTYALVCPTKIQKEYSSIKTLNTGCRLIKTYQLTVFFHIVTLALLINFLKIKFLAILIFLITAYAAELCILIGGAVRLLLKSTQIPINSKIILAWLMPIPVINYFIVRRSLRTAWQEFDSEAARIELDNTRAEDEICKTKYPILLVHGIFFRDLNYFNYWGRIPKELIRNGADIYYGSQSSAASVRDCAYELKAVIENIVETTGCEKVNIIAHSKGGLDSRYAASCLNMGDKIASITTVCTPHHGCEYADFLLERMSAPLLHYIAAKYDSTLKRFGDTNSDFIAGVTDLTAKRCEELNKEMILPEGIYCRSVGAYMSHASSAGFPLCFSFFIAKAFSKTNVDGLVDIDSMRFGEQFTLFKPKTKRGISHADVIDLMREDISGFDVREEYVKLVAELKAAGY